MQTLRIAATTLLMTLTLAGCDDDDGSPAPAPAPARTGVFTDAPVAGMAYVASPSGLSGSTTGDGEFSYRDGDTLVFTIAGLAFGPVAAGPQLTPATLAAALLDDAGDRENATINLSVLLQSLDRDGNPSNGIALRRDASLDATAAQLRRLLALAPYDFAGDIAGLLPDVDVADPLPATEHFYVNALNGNWRLRQIRHPEEGLLLPDAGSDIVLAFDNAGRYLWAEYDIPGRYSAIYLGNLAFRSAGTDVSVTLSPLERQLLAGRPAGSTDTVADVFHSAINLSGDQLVVRIDETGAVVTFERLENDRDGIVGGWAELAVDKADLGETSVRRAGSGALSFGGEIFGIFHFFTSDSRLIQVTTDRIVGVPDDEQNGVIVMDVTRTGEKLRIDRVRLDDVSTAGAVFAAGDEFSLPAATASGMLQRLVFNAKEFMQLARNTTVGDRILFPAGP